MKAVITGDIVSSRQVSAEKWLAALREVLANWGQAPKDWDVYRGDSFQLGLRPEEALGAVFEIKSYLKSRTGLEVRFGIGIGTIEHPDDTITTANGAAFERSGAAFEALGKRLLLMQSPWPSLDETMNLMFDLLAISTDRWSEVGAEMVYLRLRNPAANQQELAEKLEKSQASVSAGLKRSSYDELRQLLNYYKKQINNHVASGN